MDAGNLEESQQPGGYVSNTNSQNC